MKFLPHLSILLFVGSLIVAPPATVRAQSGPTWSESEYRCYDGAAVPANGLCYVPPTNWRPAQSVCINRNYVVVPVKKSANGLNVCPGYDTGADVFNWQVIEASSVVPGNRPGGGGGGNIPNNGAPVNSGVPCDFGTVQNGLCIPNNPVCANGGTGVACSGNVTELIARIINIMLYFAGIIAVVFVIIGGYMYMTSAGNSDRAGKGKSTFVNAIIGLVIVILAYVVVRAITNFLVN